MPSRKPGIRVCCVMTNRAMTLFTSLGPSADCRGLTQVTTYQVRTGHARGAAFSVSQRGFSLGWSLQGKVARTPHQSKGSGGTVWGEHTMTFIQQFIEKALVGGWQPAD